MLRRENKGVRKDTLPKKMTSLLLVTVLTFVFDVQLVLAEPETTLYVDPPTTKVSVGNDFVINVTVADIADLTAFTFYLGYNITMLDFLMVRVPPPFEIPIVRVEPNYIEVSAMSSISISGTFVLASISFNATAAGQCPLDLYNTILFDSASKFIHHTAFDGSVTVSLMPLGLSAELVRRRAWPEHRHYVISTDEDNYQTLHAKVKNIGNQTVWVKVAFNITKEDDSPLDVETEPLLITVDEIAELSADFGPLTKKHAGKYYVSITCWYSDNKKVWAQGEKEKTFKFVVAP